MFPLDSLTLLMVILLQKELHESAIKDIQQPHPNPKCQTHPLSKP